MSLAWVLNFDAERELRRPEGYVVRKAVLARMRSLAPAVVGLVGSDDVVLDREHPQRVDGLEGRCWCPTPSALTALRRAGARLPEVPAVEVLVRVNHRRFSAELGQTLPGAAFVEDQARLEALLGQRSSSGWWLLKRPWGFSGSERRRVRVGQRLAPDLAWIEASLRQDGLQVEPWLDELRDLSIHGMIEQGGGWRIGRICRQRCTPQGAWIATEPIGDAELTDEDRRQLRDEAERVAGALARAGYFGPFGIDAYFYRIAERWQLNPRSEINARYTMGWAVGMGMD